MSGIYGQKSSQRTQDEATCAKKAMHGVKPPLDCTLQCRGDLAYQPIEEPILDQGMSLKLGSQCDRVGRPLWLLIARRPLPDERVA